MASAAVAVQLGAGYHMIEDNRSQPLFVPGTFGIPLESAVQHKNGRRSIQPDPPAIKAISPTVRRHARP